jgi:hypothetical protein
VFDIHCIRSNVLGEWVVLLTVTGAQTTAQEKLFGFLLILVRLMLSVVFWAKVTMNIVQIKCFGVFYAVDHPSGLGVSKLSFFLIFQFFSEFFSFGKKIVVN